MKRAVDLDNDESYLVDCLIKAREGERGPMFHQEVDRVVARLHGYAIVPREEYEALVTSRQSAD
jgi:hypothetical protein